MPIQQISVRFWLEGKWGELETFDIVEQMPDPQNMRITKDSPLFKAMMHRTVGDEVKVLKGQLYLLEGIVGEPDQEPKHIERRTQYGRFAHKDLQNLISQSENYKNETEYLNSGANFVELVANSIYIPKGTIDLFEKIVSAYLTHSDVENALEWVDQIDSNKVNVKRIYEKLKEIQQQQNGLAIENITNVYVLNNLGTLHKELGVYNKALEIYKRSLNLEPSNVVTLNSLGGLCRYARWYENGIKYYTKSNEIRKNHYAYNGLGGIYRCLQEPGIARKHFMEALTFEQLSEKEKTFAYNGIGATYFDQRMFSEGEEFFMKIRSPRNMEKIAWEYYHQGLVDQALRCAELILEIDPDDTRGVDLQRRFSRESR